MKQISLKGLADFMTASPSRQRTIIRQYKYPTEDESRAKILYYREARDRIEVFHRAGHHPSWLIQEAAHLELLASSSAGATRTRLKHNVRAIRAYARNLGSRVFKVLPTPPLAIVHGDVRVSTIPDLLVIEIRRKKLLKLEFGVNEPARGIAKIVCQALFESSRSAGLGIQSSCVLYVDVERGKEHKAARAGARVQRDIEAACQTISAVWDSL